MRIREYRAGDQPACLAIFDSNIPDFFARHERLEFAAFLAAPDCHYFVIEDDTGDPAALVPPLIGCGGYFYNPETRAGALCWGMVARAHHKTGAGTALLRFRLGRICADSDGVAMLMMNTSQHTQGFFAKFGFEIVRVVEHGLAPDLHQIDMRLDLTPERCADWVTDAAAEGHAP